MPSRIGKGNRVRRTGGEIDFNKLEMLADEYYEDTRERPLESRPMAQDGPLSVERNS